MKNVWLKVKDAKLDALARKLTEHFKKLTKLAVRKEIETSF
jgi:hypothetical protein